MKVQIGGVGFYEDFTEVIDIDKSKVWDREKLNSVYGYSDVYPDLVVWITKKTLENLNLRAWGMKDCICGSGVSILAFENGEFMVRCDIV